MRRALTVTALLCLAINCVSQTPKETTKTSKTQQSKQPATNPPNQTVAIYEQPRGKDNNETRNKDQQEIDIQRQLTKFTGWLVGVGFLQFIILAVQAVLFFQQKKIMGQHKTSLEEIATAAVKNATTTENALKLSERAEVLLDQVIIKVAGQFNNQASIELVLKNCGRTKAEGVVGDFKLIVKDVVRHTITSQPTALGAGQTHIIKFPRFQTVLTTPEFDQVLRGEINMCLYGIYNYDDMFGGSYTRQCVGTFVSASNNFTIDQRT